ncbi:MAG: response regulator transcription factor [Bacteroidia bacterium]
MSEQERIILLADDDKEIRNLLQYNLKNDGFKVYSASDGEEAIAMAVKYKPDLILLDIMMPKKDGIECCQTLRAMPEFEQTLIAILTARAESYSQIAGFEAGADDYITKPIKPKVLMARIHALFKRQRTDTSKVIVTLPNDTVINTDERLVYVKNKKIELPKKEYELLLLLSSKVGKVFSRNRIYNVLWNNQLDISDRTLDVHIRKLRQKIGEHQIKTVKGVGYKLSD